MGIEAELKARVRDSAREHRGRVDAALETIRAILGELGIQRTEETTETYIDAVTARRP